MYYTFLEYTPRECQKPTAHHYLNPPLRTNLPAGLHAYISRHTTPPPPFLSPIRQLGTPGPYWISQGSATRLFFPVQFLPFDYHQPHELIIPSVRILVKDREVAEGIPQHIVTTKGPMWGYPRGRFWDLGTVLEPFCGKLLPQVDKPVKD